MSLRYLRFTICLLIILATVAVYAQVRDFEFLNYDDYAYVTENYAIHSGLTPKGVVWAFTASHCDNWHPVTWLSHMLDCQLFGLDPGWHHLVNVFFHVVNSILLFLLLEKLTAALWPSALVAALFALHPVHVESVAWVSERKDVLSVFFFLATIWAYARYAAQPRAGRYLPILLFYALGLMAKPMLVTLPFVLLLLDYWPLGRFAPLPPPEQKRGRAASREPRRPPRRVWGLIREKIPLLILAAASCGATLLAQKRVLMNLDLTIWNRLGNALVAYVRYLGKTFWPLNLAVFYPHPGNSLPWWQALAAAILLAGVSYLVLKKGRAHPYLPVGWFWYLGTLVPVIGLVQVGEQALADRYTYIPLIGIFIILAWGAADLTAGWRRRKLVCSLAAGLLLAILMVLTWFQVSHWRAHYPLFEHAARVTGNNYLADSMLITQYAARGDLDQARSSFQKAIKAMPDYAVAYNAMGIAYNLNKHLAEAREMFQKAVELNPTNPEYFLSLGKVLAEQGNADAAIDMFRKAIQLQPDYAEAYNNLGIDLGRQKRFSESIAALKKAIDIRPAFSEAYCNLGIAFAQQGRLPEAKEMLEKAVLINPKNAGAQKLLDLVKANLGN